MSARILIVDDNPTNLRLAASVLELDGHVVETAADADEAMARLTAATPDLVLMDIALPGTDGLSLTRRIKADPRWAALPVVALTAFAMKGDDQRAREAGCVGYLTKPIDTREFGRQVAAFLPVPAQTLLIVDDHPANLRLLRAQLETAGHRVVEAANGVEALERLDEAAVDGIISDILMPRMDGYRLCMEVRKREAHAGLPFVLYTSTYDSPADRRLATAAGADAYVAKPAPVAELLAALDAASRRERPPPQPVAELEDPVLKQYSESLIRKLEEKSAQLGQAYEGLAQTEARLSGLVESALDAIIALDEAQNILIFNSAAEQMFRCSRDQALGQSIDRFIPARFRNQHRGQVRRFGEGDDQGRRMGARTVWALRADGEEFPVEASISRQDTSRGWVFTVFLRDVTDRHVAEQALASSEARLRRVNRVLAVLSGINTLIVRANHRDELLQEACRIAVERGAFPKAWIGLVDEDSGRLDLAAAAGGDPAYREELRQRLADQDARRHGPWLQALRELHPIVINDLRAEPLALSSALASSSRSMAALPLAVAGRAVGVVVLHADEPGFFDSEEMDLLREMAGDISFALDHLGKADQLRFLANCDALTGLPNRASFAETLGREFRAAAAREDDGRIAVVLFDLERFRRVNETLGRSGGDELLRQVAARLAQGNDSVARLGVDVFALRLAGLHDAAGVAHAVAALAQSAFGPSFGVGGEELRVGCRAGIAVYPDDGDAVDTLLHNAEAALRRARTAAEPFVFYAPDLNARAAEALSLESRLRRAIDQDEFLLHYQPKVAMADRRIVGVEALIRWRPSDEEGLVPPGRFIPVLEEIGLIGQVGSWALRRALADQAAWRAQGLAAPRVAVNVSPLQLRRPDFAEEIHRKIGRHEQPALELEITESVIMDDVERNIVALSRVRDAGVTVAVDDFGTGYCSLAYIAKLPVNSLKVDRSFVVGMTGGPEGLAIVSSIIALAHALKLKVVAEGVETEEQARLLHLLGCDEAQGYLYSRPVPADELARLL